MFCLLFTGVRHPIDYKLSRTRDGHSKSFRRYVILWLLVFLLPCALVRLKLVSIEKFVPSVPSVPFYFVFCCCCRCRWEGNTLTREQHDKQSNLVCVEGGSNQGNELELTVVHIPHGWLEHVDTITLHMSLRQLFFFTRVVVAYLTTANVCRFVLHIFFLFCLFGVSPFTQHACLWSATSWRWFIPVVIIFVPTREPVGWVYYRDTLGMHESPTGRCKERGGRGERIEKEIPIEREAKERNCVTNVSLFFYWQIADVWWRMSSSTCRAPSPWTIWQPSFPTWLRFARI